MHVGFCKALQVSHSSVVWVAIRYSVQIFSMNMPGASILIPDYLKEIEKLVRLHKPRLLGCLLIVLNSFLF